MVTKSTGIISTFAGNGNATFSGDGDDATSASLHQPTGVCLDSTGNLYIGDSNNHRIRKVTASTSIISTIAGSSTSSGYNGGAFSGDGGAATSAALNYPSAMCFDSSGIIFDSLMYQI